MQQQMMRQQEDVDQELDEVKSQLSAAERDRNRAFEELREINLKLSRINGENNAELNDAKESLLSANKELKIKDQTIESLQFEVNKVKELESKLAEKDAELEAMKQELSLSNETVAKEEGLYSECKKKMEELEAEVERRKESEAKQTNQLQEAESMLEKQRLEAESLRKNLHELEEEMRQREEAAGAETRRLRDEVFIERQNSAKAKDGDKDSAIETKTLLNEIEFLKTELKRAMEAEENRDKAMEDLALTLREVVADSKQAKEKLALTEQQLEAVKEEAANLKKMVKSTKGTYEAVLKETSRENEKLTNIVNRLRLEAEESLLAWNGKEIEFVKCIKKAEDEKNAVQEDYDELKQSMKESQGQSEKSKEETKKLRDILKQALNEANVAKEAASLARDENSYLKDSLAEKDKALLSLAQETERLRINEAEANESIKELKRVLTSGSKKKVVLKLEDDSKEQKKTSKKDPATGDNNAVTEKEPRERKLSNTFSFDLNQLWPSIPGIATKSSKDNEEDPDKDDALGGSIFDLVESPEKELPPYHRRTSSACSSSDDGNALAFGNFDEDDHFDDMEIERSSQGKRKALLRRFGDLLRRKNSHPPKDLPHPPKDLPHPPKEVAHPPKEVAPKDLPHPPKEVAHPPKEVAA